MLNDWHALGSVQYRKWQVYDMAWTSEPSKPFPLENYVVCGAPFGGPIAMYPDPKKGTDSASRTATTLLMYSSSGRKISEMEWTDRPIVSLGWSDHELLVVVAENGKYLNLQFTYNMLLTSFFSSHINQDYFECLTFIVDLFTKCSYYWIFMVA